MLGNVKIFFGKVSSIDDTQKICRVKVVVNGLTDKLSVEDLPWYFPWYGIKNLPMVDDVVPVLIFDNVITSGFYGNKIDLVDNSLGDDYNNYLEIFKRNISDKNVQLTYKESTGIEFINGDSKIQLELNKISLFQGSNSITIEKDKINIGDNAEQFVILGDKGRDVYSDILNSLDSICDEFISTAQFITGGLSASANPFTAAFAVPFTQLAVNMSVVKANIAKIKPKIEQSALQSKKVKIE